MEDIPKYWDCIWATYTQVSKSPGISIPGSPALAAISLTPSQTLAHSEMPLLSLDHPILDMDADVVKHHGPFCDWLLCQCHVFHSSTLQILLKLHSGVSNFLLCGWTTVCIHLDRHLEDTSYLLTAVYLLL